MKERSLRMLGLQSCVCLLALGLALALTGCSGFFVPVNSTGTGTGTGTGSGSTTPTGADYVYVGNTATMTLSGFLVGSGTLTTLPSMPYDLGFSPTAMVVNPADTFLYVAGASAIYVLPINSDGSITVSIAEAGTAIVTTQAIDISPDGNWLFALDATNFNVDIYQINQTTGALTAQTPVALGVASSLVRPVAVKVAPSGSLVVAALGTAGDVVFSFNTSTGALVNVTQVPLTSGLTSDNALAIDSTSSYLYIARTGNGGGLVVYSIGGNGALTPVTGSPFTAGSQPLSVVLDATGKYVYVANGNGGTISGFTIGTGGVLTALSGSPYTSGAQVNAIGRDNSGDYILAAAYDGSPDLTMYSFDTTVPGKLDTATTAQTGIDPAGANTIALTH